MISIQKPTRSKTGAWLGQLCACLFFLALPLFAQDVVIPNAGPYFTLVRNASPGISGGGGLNNTYIISPSDLKNGFCMQVINKHATQTVTVVIGVAQTVDTSITTFTGNTSKWVQSATLPVVVLNLGSSLFYIPATGGTKYAFTFSGASANGGPVDVTLTQSSPCNNGSLIGTGSTIGPGGTSFICPLVQGGITVASGTTTKLVALAVANTSAKIHVCSYSVTIGGATVTAVKNLFISGTGVGCVTNTATAWALQTGTTTSQIFQMGPGLGQIFDTGATGGGGDLCYTDAGTTAGSVVNISYAVF